MKFVFFVNGIREGQIDYMSENDCRIYANRGDIVFVDEEYLINFVNGKKKYLFSQEKGK